MNRLSRSAGIALLAALVGPVPVPAEVVISGITSFVARNAEEDLTNVNFRGTSNLDVTRTRVFFDAYVEEKIQLFAQVLVSGSKDFRVYSAYLRFEEIGSSPVNVHLGLIPAPVGNFAPRTYEDRNPLVGIPLLWNHHTALRTNAEYTGVDDLLAASDERSRLGLPIQYDACWNTGLELWGQAGAFDWSVAALSGAGGRPKIERERETPQVTGRLAWAPSPVFVFGVSGWYGPYFVDGDKGLQGTSPEDHMNRGAAVDVAWTRRHLELHSEVFVSSWEHPVLPTLTAVSGYLEANYKFHAQWFVAGRWDVFEPGKVTNGTGESVKWDYSLHRIEVGMGYRVARRVTIKAVVQDNDFRGSQDLDRIHFMAQTTVGF